MKVVPGKDGLDKLPKAVQQDEYEEEQGVIHGFPTP
jgi:hypothetical protein